MICRGDVYVPHFWDVANFYRVLEYHYQDVVYLLYQDMFSKMNWIIIKILSRCGILFFIENWWSVSFLSWCGVSLSIYSVSLSIWSRSQSIWWLIIEIKCKSLLLTWWLKIEFSCILELFSSTLPSRHFRENDCRIWI
jgi:hypothetical protein